VTTPACSRWRVLGTNALLVTDDPQALDAARDAADAEIDAIDRACSRFRDDSELTLLNAEAGRPVTVSPTLADALGVALRAAEITDGRVDPTVGADLRMLGYDRDFAAVPPDGPALPIHLGPRGGWHAIAFDRATATVCVPSGVELDFGATAKALAADRAARAATDATGAGVLVSLGGDIAVAGQAPAEGWSVHVTDDHAAGPDAPGVDVAIFSGGLATSSTTVRRWRRGDQEHHHVVDPSTGRPADGPWRTVTVAAGTCVDANLASTASIVMGDGAPAWLQAEGLPSRLVAHDGTVVTVAGWPQDGARP
jgi:thiamine biosynthesis lipoprotein ApbE